ncbi:helix-turn-helix domain-containing protein [Aliikangiella coralliicola]|uniref:MerR family transcriptional regulator n=1 Tax=Aliikangiella coralliicola TaxID=2592383 RepID=A0A545UIX2_9GAMM|nr:helix-turn-helix domain-containing protein [Aliikangiella coralliicola]TQV89412.1 MerR family transcriptional regulator [Aliikangiella coralliicola]
MTQTTIIDIGEVARQSGLPPSTLRFYEEKGLIQSTGRHGLRRLFNSNVLQRLALIALGQSAGFSLEEISAMFTAEGPEIDREQLLAKAAELDENIQQLKAMRDGLLHAADCPAPSHLECPSFQRMLRLAGKGQLKRRQKSTRR